MPLMSFNANMVVYLSGQMIVKLYIVSYLTLHYIKYLQVKYLDHCAKRNARIRNETGNRKHDHSH